VRRSYYGLPKLPLLPRGPQPPQLVIPNDERVIAYLAGLMDGEGSVFRMNGRPCVQIGMTDEGVIRWLRETLGGNLTLDPRKPPRKQLYRWRVFAQRDVLRFLWAVYPYMRVRRHPAGEAILEIHGKAEARLDELLALEAA
jgi:hypothetical protein